MASKFCQKYFQTKDQITMEDLNAALQGPKEGLVDYLKRFRNLALDCYQSKSKEELVHLCIDNMVNNQRVFLKNHGISTFSLLLEKASRIVLSTRAIPTLKRWQAPQAAIAERRFQPYKKRMPRKESLTCSKLPYMEENLKLLWIANHG